MIKNEEGYIFFKARKDNQIKHMGYRIELGEIESRIREIENIDDCAVISKADASEDDQFGYGVPAVSMRGNCLIDMCDTIS